MKPLLINFVGAPSVGKSTISALTFVKLKTNHHSSELVQEYAKQLVWSENFEDLSNQWYVSKKQYEMLKAVYGKVDYLVTDSPLILGLHYNRYHKDNVSDIKKTETMILSKMKEFNNVYILLKRNTNIPYEKIGRIHNEQQSMEIEKNLKNILDEFNIKYLEITSDVNNIEKIMKYIYSH
jgi:nicotinamide riboside kinase